MAKINFCGDSFCKSNIEESWTYQIASRLDAEIIGLGIGGTAIEHVFKTFDPKADYTIFCWTEPHRLYHPKYKVSTATCNHYVKTRPENKIWAAGHVYYKYLHNWEVAEERYVRELFWFDQCVLKEYAGKAIHLFCFECLYKFENGVTFSNPLNLRRNVPFALDNSEEVANHFTAEQNKQLADELYECLKQ